MSESIAQLSQSIDETLVKLDSLRQLPQSDDIQHELHCLCKSLALLYNNRGLLYYKTIEFNLAANDYTQAIQLDPLLATAYYNRATIHYRMNTFDRALDDFKIAIDLDPNNSEFRLAFDSAGDQLKDSHQTTPSQS